MRTNMALSVTIIALLSLVISIHAQPYQVILNSTGVAGMHLAVTCDGKVAILDRSNQDDPDDIPVCAPGQAPIGCKIKHVKVASSLDPTVRAVAHTFLWDPVTNTLKPLDSITNTFCSGGGLDAQGNVIVIGGSKLGVRSIRRLKIGASAWELLGQTTTGRWYPTVEKMPDGRMLIFGGQLDLGGLNNPTFEYYPKKRVADTQFDSRLLKETAPENLYPFTHLLPDNKVFILAYNKAVIFNWQTNVETYLPDCPGWGRSYHFMGSAVLLPLRAPLFTAEVLVCGGASAKMQRPATPATASCGRICLHNCLNSTQYKWDASDSLPRPRHMATAVLTPDLKVVFLGGAGVGISKYKNLFSPDEPANKPVFWPAVYTPMDPPAKRFKEDWASNIARMYHSSMILLPDARVLVAGSNPNSAAWRFSRKSHNVTYLTEFRAELYSPPYLRSGKPRVTLASVTPAVVPYGSIFTVKGTMPPGITMRRKYYKVVIASMGFSTHGYIQTQRMVVPKAIFKIVNGTFIGKVTAPDQYLLPPSCYFVFVTVKDEPCTRAISVKFGPSLV